MQKRRTIFSLVLGSVLVLISMSSKGQNLIQYQSNATALNESQAHYLDEIMSWPMSRSYDLASIDFEMLGKSQLQFRLKNGLVIDAHRLDRDIPDRGSRVSWVGEFPGASGNAHLVYMKDKNHLIAHVQFEDVSFLIRSLGDGLHAIIDWDMTMSDGCLTTAESGKGSQKGRGNPEAYLDMTNPDVQIDVQKGSSGSRMATGECAVRVLVAYTSAAASAVTDILSDAINMTNLGNTSYSNSSLAYTIELAGLYNIAYTESGDLETDRNRFRATSDGHMDDIHTQRSLWRADQCMLLTSTGSGIAFISTDFADQFSVTGVPNFNAFTFHHELGHCNECTHATNQGPFSSGDAPFAGWGDPGNCFRTVMAYPEACGGAGNCPRHNIWSDNDPNSWTCNGSLYTPGTSNARNQDRLVLSYPVIRGHTAVNQTAIYSGDYDWNNNECIHFAAEQSLQYNSTSTNKFEFNSGSEGSFRASDFVVLGEGFHAKYGSDFRGYLESCP